MKIGRWTWTVCCFYFKTMWQNFLFVLFRRLNKYEELPDNPIREGWKDANRFFSSRYKCHWQNGFIHRDIGDRLPDSAFAGWWNAFCFRSLPFVKHDVNLTLFVDWSTPLCLGPVGLTSRPIVSDWWSLGLTPSDPGRCSVSHSRFCFPSFSTGSLAQHATGHSCHSVYCLLLACSSPLALYCELSKNTHSIFFELTWLSYVFFLNSWALLTRPWPCLLLSLYNCSHIYETFRPSTVHTL